MFSEDFWTNWWAIFISAGLAVALLYLALAPDRESLHQMYMKGHMVGEAKGVTETTRLFQRYVLGNETMTAADLARQVKELKK
jgi:hypothetical protein